MKTRFLFLAVILMFGFRSYPQTIRISSGASDTICYGTSVTFTATVTPTGNYGYDWKVNGVSVGGSVSTYTTTTLTSGKDTVFCILTNVAGDTIKALSDTVIMIVDSLPRVASITGEDSICVGNTSQLSDIYQGGTWSSSSTTVAIVSANGLVTGISVPVGMFGGLLPPAPVYITYTASNGCGIDSLRTQVYIGASAGPISAPADTLCTGSMLMLTDTASGGSWATSDSTVASFPLAGFDPGLGELQGNTTGMVTITYSGSNGCGAYSETTVISVLNCDSIDAVPQVASLAEGCSIYPNPATGAFYVTVRSGKYSEVSCTVSDMVGEKVKDWLLNTNQATPVQMNVPAGVYFITLSAGDEKYTSKLVIIQ